MSFSDSESRYKSDCVQLSLFDMSDSESRSRLVYCIEVLKLYMSLFDSESRCGIILHLVVTAWYVDSRFASDSATV